MGAPGLNLAKPCCYTAETLLLKAGGAMRQKSILTTLRYFYGWATPVLAPASCLCFLCWLDLTCNQILDCFLTEIQLQQSTLFMHGFYFRAISVRKSVFSHINAFFGVEGVKKNHHHRHVNNLYKTCLIKMAAFAVKVIVLWSKGSAKVHFLTVNNIHKINKIHKTHQLFKKYAK